MVIVGRDRNGKLDVDKESGFVKFLYGNSVGRTIAKVLSMPFISQISAFFLKSSLSDYMVKDFIKNNNIDITKFSRSEYKSFNDFFTRVKKPEFMNVDMNPDSFISPCDGKVLCYKISERNDFKIKNSYYTVGDLLNGDPISANYHDGYMIIIRLRPKDYHRYIYIDNGQKTGNIHIKGVLNALRPIAYETETVYKRNTREFTVLRTENFGDIVQIEVGAMLVGKINNYHGDWQFKRGEEKGMFEFGGSTIVLLVQNGKVVIDEDIIKNTSEDVETYVECGSKIGRKMTASEQEIVNKEAVINKQEAVQNEVIDTKTDESVIKDNVDSQNTQVMNSQTDGVVEEPVEEVSSATTVASEVDPVSEVTQGTSVTQNVSAGSEQESASSTVSQNVTDNAISNNVSQEEYVSWDISAAREKLNAASDDASNINNGQSN